MSSTRVIRRREDRVKTHERADACDSSLVGAPSFQTAAVTFPEGVTVSIRQAATYLGISTSTAYRLAEQGRFPVSILRIGGQYRIPSKPLLEALGYEVDAERSER